MVVEPCRIGAHTHTHMPLQSAWRMETTRRWSVEAEMRSVNMAVRMMSRRLSGDLPSPCSFCCCYSSSDIPSLSCPFAIGAPLGLGGQPSSHAPPLLSQRHEDLHPRPGAALSHSPRPVLGWLGCHCGGSSAEGLQNEGMPWSACSSLSVDNERKEWGGGGWQPIGTGGNQLLQGNVVKVNCWG